jgi:hypothetical protein
VRVAGGEADVSRRRDWKWWLITLVVAYFTVAATNRLPFIPSLTICIVVGLIVGYAFRYLGRRR